MNQPEDFGSMAVAMDNSALTERRGRKKSVVGRESLDLTWTEVKWPLAFMLCMSALGLKFPLAYILIPVILIARFREDRYDFVIMFTILMGEYGLVSKNTFGFHPYFIALGIAFAGCLLYKKSRLVKKLLSLCFLYFAGIFIFAMMSEECLSLQLGSMLRYMTIIYFIIPLMCFSNTEFDIKVFFRKLMPYALIMCIFYCLDCFIVNGWIFLPNTPLPEWAGESLFYSPVVRFFGYFPRKYPQGLIFILIVIYPIVKYYKLNWWQWLVVCLALFSCRTFTVITGMIATYILCQGNIRRFFKYMVGGIIVVIGLYFVDSHLPVSGDQQSTLRIKSSFDQFLIFQTMEDEEDLAKLGTGRMAQILPKMELLYELNRQWIGFGFLHPGKTTISKYIIENPLYLEDVVKEEVAAVVEVTAVQHILYMGYLGLIMVICFYLLVLRLIKNMEYRHYVYSIIFGVVWFGIAGFGGLLDAYTLLLVSLALSAVLLENRNLEKGNNCRNEVIGNHSRLQ